MLTEVKIENFKCLRSVQVPLKPLTVLIGANDTGKSAFLSALHCLWTPNSFLTDPAHYWQHDNQLAVSIEADSPDGKGMVSTRGNNTAPLRQHISPTELFRLPSAGVSMQSPGVDVTSSAPSITPDGGTVAALFDYLLRRNRKQFFAAIEVMRELIPGFVDLEIATPEPSLRRLHLVIENGLRIPGESASAGVRLLLTFIALAYHPTPPRLILIEEPENGVHPKRLADVMRLLREMTEGKHGLHASQVVLTTHSPYLLDLVELDRDQLLVFQREDDGSRTAVAADADRLRTFLDGFLLGEVWYNQGEEGLLPRARV